MKSTSEVDNCPRCQKCERWRAAPDYLRDPMILWDRFPCPPPGTDHTRLLLELDWTRHMGTKDGCEALKRVARRCHVDLKNLHSLPSSLPNCEELFDTVDLCGTSCFIAFILAGVCLLFCLLLVVVCIRYVRRTNKQSSPICTKVLSSERAAVNTHINKDYAQTQYLYRHNGIPDRRGLPCEARVTNNGVEARLLKAIQENQLSQYSGDALCSQCLTASRQNTIQCGRNRQGYEIIYWKDGDFFLKRVPSNLTMNRSSLNRDMSLSPCEDNMSQFKDGRSESSANVSNIYEHISDHFTDCSCNSAGRQSNHSAKYIHDPRSSFQNIQNAEHAMYDPQTDVNRENAVEWRSDNDHYANCRKNWKARRTSMTSLHSKYQDSGQDVMFWTDRSPYQPSGSDKSTYQGNMCDKTLFQGYYSDTSSDILSKNKYDRNTTSSWRVSNEINNLNENTVVDRNSKASTQTNNIIKGYRYAFNPSCEEDFNFHVSSDTKYLQNLTSELFEIDEPVPDCNYKSKVKQRRTSTCSNTSNHTENASINGHSGCFTEPRRTSNISDTKFTF